MSTPLVGASQIAQYRLNMLTQNGVGGVGGSTPAGGGTSGLGQSGGASFGDTLKNAINQVSSAQDNANEQVSAFLRGDPVELHSVMAATEEAGIALEMMIEIRNKVTEAYRTMINMQS